jgi:hypothetical protein
MRSRIVSAAATNQSRSVATDASLPRSSASLASTVLLISSRSSFSAGAVARCLDGSPSPGWFALAGAEFLDEQARKEADEKAWADAEKAGTASAFTSYVQKFASGAHVAEARKRAAALETQGRKEVPSIDIQKTCQAAAGAMVSLMGGTTTEQDVNACR